MIRIKNHIPLKSMILTIIIIGLCLPVFAAFVQPDRAALAAINWLSYRNSSAQTLSVSEIRTFDGTAILPARSSYDLEREALPQLFLVHFSNGAYAIVAAEDNALPILAYDLNSALDKDDIPPAVMMWLRYYADEVALLRESEIQIPERMQDWTDVLNGNLSRFDGYRNVSPLVSTMWNQDWPYNELCPADPAGPGGRVYAGCVATAMGMVMKYWNSPITGQGSNTYYAGSYGYQSANFGNTTYLWDQMPNSISSSNMPIATLLYHLAVSVNMGFSPEGSGSNGTYAASSMRNNFRYPNAVLSQKNNYSATGWENLMRAQIDNGTPMYYSGTNQTVGHAFVLDGYQGTNHFHFNFGWSGSYNGYYYVNALNPGSNNFNLNQSAITNAIPQNYTIASPRVQLILGTAMAGDPFEVRMTTYPVLSTWDVTSYSFDLFYDHTYVDYQGYSIEGTISEDGNISVVETEPGFLHVSWNRAAALFGGGTLVKFNFFTNEPGEYYFDTIDMRYNNTYLQNVEHLMAGIPAPVASLQESSISMTNAMQIQYNQIASLDLRTSHLVPSWNVTSYSFGVNYDPAKVEFHGLDTVNTLSAGSNPTFEPQSAGSVLITCATSTPLTGDGALVKLLFRAVGNSSSSSATHISPQAFMYNQTPIPNVSNGYIVLAPYTSNEDEVAAPQLSLKAYPNPFNPSTKISFTTGKILPASVKIYNLKGQMIKTLAQGNLPAGDHTMIWNGTDDNNQPQASGIYFVRLIHDKQIHTLKLLMVK